MVAPRLLVPRVRVGQCCEVLGGGRFHQRPQRRVVGKGFSGLAQPGRPGFQDAALVGPHDRLVDGKLLDGQSGAAVADVLGQTIEILGGQPSLDGLGRPHLWVRQRQHRRQHQIVSCWQGRAPQAERPLRLRRGGGRGSGVERLGLAVPQRQHPGRGQLRALLSQAHQFVGPLEFLLNLGRRRAPGGLDSHLGLHPGRQHPGCRNDGAAAPCAGTHDLVAEDRGRSSTARGGQRACRGVPPLQPATKFSRVFGQGGSTGGEPGMRLSENLDGKPLCALTTRQHQRLRRCRSQFPSTCN